MWEICRKVPRHELVLVNGLEKPVVTHGTVLRTHKDAGLEADETNAEHILRTPEVPPNGYEAAEQEAELQPIRELHTSPNRLPPRTHCQQKSQIDSAGMRTCPSFIKDGVATRSPSASTSDPESEDRRSSLLSGTGGSS